MTDLRTRPAASSAEAPTAPRILYALCGVLAALAGIAVGHLVAAVTNAAASPVLSVGSVVIDLTPTPVKEYVIARVGTADKPILLATVSLATLALAALAGLLSRRHPAVGAGVLLLLVAAAGGAAMTRPTARLLDLLPALATAIVGVGALLGLRRSAGAGHCRTPGLGRLAAHLPRRRRGHYRRRRGGRGPGPAAHRAGHRHPA